ncbi:MAG: hypothetical protein HYS98_07970 [Deltaproteobacteria bacterium]|nr:hypothetical protein [Deltaproteobacteria bacterium]
MTNKSTILVFAVLFLAVGVVSVYWYFKSVKEGNLNLERKIAAVGEGVQAGNYFIDHLPTFTDVRKDRFLPHEKGDIVNQSSVSKYCDPAKPLNFAVGEDGVYYSCIRRTE